MSIAEKPNPSDYQTFNDFFIRKLKTSVRPIDFDQNVIVCPTDSAISQIGDILDGKIIQAKNINYSLDSLLTEKKYSANFKNGKFITLYLSPKDYHRVHLPFAGTLEEMIYVPGELFSVNSSSAEAIPGLFARNERVICIFKTEIGLMTVIMVGATLVASISTAWGGKITPNKNRSIQSWHYHDQNIKLTKGSEIGHFELGSTVIVLFEPDKMKWNPELKPENFVPFGHNIGRVEK